MKGEPKVAAEGRRSRRECVPRSWPHDIGKDRIDCMRARQDKKQRVGQTPARMGISSRPHERQGGSRLSLQWPENDFDHSL